MIPFNQPAVRRYLNDIGRHPLMTPAEEIACGKLVQEANALLELDRQLTPSERKILKRAERAKKRFIEANLRMVVSIAKKYANSYLQSLELLDLVQEGSMGLMRAVDMYDPTRGYKFSTYAYWWIRQAMTRALGQKEPMIRLPHSMVDNILKMKKVVREQSQKLGRMPSKTEIAAILNVTEQQLEELVGRSLPVVSLNLTCGNDDENSLLDIIADPESLISWDEAFYLQVGLRHDSLNQSLMRLNDRDRDLICMRYGLMGHEQTTLTKIGERQGVSRERIRQLLTKAENKLKIEMNRELTKAKLIHAGETPNEADEALSCDASVNDDSLPPALPETLPMQDRQALWRAPVRQHAARPCAKLTAA